MTTGLIGNLLNARHEERANSNGASPRPSLGGRLEPRGKRAARTLRVLVTDEISPEGMRMLEREPALQIRARLKMSREELLREVRDTEVLVIRTETRVDGSVIAAAPKLLLVARAGVGLDNVDVPAATRRGILVLNTPDSNTRSAAELTLAHLLASSRHLPEADASVRSRRWERGRFMGRELADKTLGIVGLGRIGSTMARFAQALSMKVIAYDPYLPKGRAESLGVQMTDLRALLRRSDYVTLHVPLTAETKGMIGARELRWMKRTAFIVNCARGGVIEEQALAKALTAGALAGASLDVYSQEPPSDLPILGAPRLTLTPHVGAATHEAQARVGTDLARQILEFVKSGEVPTAANLPAIDPAHRDRLHPTLLLAERIGRLASQLLGAPAEEIALKHSGDASVAPQAVTVWAVRGFLAPALGESVNYVNAMSIASERGLRVTEMRTADDPEVRSRIEFTAKGRKRALTVVGTVVAGRGPRLVSLDGMALDADLEGHLIVVRNQDRPGVIGSLGTVLGKGKVNIAEFHLGRNEPKGRAVSIIAVDGAPDPRILARLHSLPNVLSVQHVAL